ncbi:MAG: hypothetical protein WAM82_21165, partial [Thermoanaerobaculia bacterium]
SGSWYVALGYVCSGDQIKKVIEISSLAPIVMTEALDGKVEFVIWQQYQGSSPPGKRKTVRAYWNQQKGEIAVNGS